MDLYSGRYAVMDENDTVITGGQVSLGEASGMEMVSTGENVYVKPSRYINGSHVKLYNCTTEQMIETPVWGTAGQDFHLAAGAGYIIIITGDSKHITTDSSLQSFSTFDGEVEVWGGKIQRYHDTLILDNSYSLDNGYTWLKTNYDSLLICNDILIGTYYYKNCTQGYSIDNLTSTTAPSLLSGETNVLHKLSEILKTIS